MKLIKANLLQNVTNTYDQTKTTTQGRVSQKTFSGKDYLGAPLTKFNDFFTEVGFAPSGPIQKTSNNRIFVLFFVSSGVYGLALYNHNPLTNVNTYVGQIRFVVPNVATTTHTIRSLKVIDNGVTGWKVFLSTTGTVVYNGGTILVNNVDLADFVPTPTTIGFATGNNQKAVYRLQDTTSVTSASVTVTAASPAKVLYTGHPFHENQPVQFIYGTLPTGLALNTVYYVRNPTANDFELSTTIGGAPINTTGSAGTAQIAGVYYQTSIAGSFLDSSTNRLYVHNGTAATHQYHIYDTNATPIYSKTTGLTIDDINDVIIHSGHQFQNNDPVLITDLVGGAGLTNNTVYFVRNATSNGYQLSATSGGAAINITTPGTVSVGRAFGITDSLYLFKTGNLPSLTGTLLASDSEKRAIPQHTSNAGFPCAFFATTTNLYLGRISDLTNGATTWSSLVTSNLLGSGNQITTPTASFATWSDSLDAAIYVTNGSRFVIKKVINNQIQTVFGRLNNTYYEGNTIPETVPIGLITIGGIDIQSGCLVFTGTTIGQRGFTTCDLRSDANYDYSYIVTPVLDTPSSIYEVLASIEARLVPETGGLVVYYRTSGFSTITGGWTILPTLENLNSIAPGNKIQFKILFQIEYYSFSTPSQVNEIFLGLTSNSEISDNWEFSDDFSDNNVPSRITFRLKHAYTGSVPTLYFRAYDLNDVLLINNNTVTHSSKFEYSTNNGLTWNPLGTIPNTVGTLLRYTFTTPPGVEIRPSLRES